MPVPNFLSKTGANADCPVTFLAKTSTSGDIPDFLAKEKVAESLEIQADLIMAQLVWYQNADLDLHSFYKQAGREVHCYHANKPTNLAWLNEDSGRDGVVEYDYNPYSGKKEQCYSEMLYISNPLEFEMWVQFYALKVRGIDNFNAISPMARVAFLKKTSEEKDGFFGKKPASYRTSQFVDVVFDKSNKALSDSSMKWFSCFNIQTKNAGLPNQTYLIKATGTLQWSQPRLDLLDTPGNARTAFPGF